MIYCLSVCIFLVIIFVLCRSCYEVSHFTVKRYEFENAKAKAPVKLLYISDLHENCFGNRNEHLLRAVREERPDCIIIGGDLIIGKEKRIKTKNALEFLRSIEGICPVLYSFGNHETRVRDHSCFKSYMKEVEKLHIQILNNEGIHMEFHGTEISFWGLELDNSCYKKGSYTAGKNPFENTEDKDIRILIAHNPNFFDEYVKWNPDYVLSGHNHGGIVRLPGINGVISTEKKLFPRYSYGVYRKEHTDMILSGGAGTHTIKFRLFNKSEIVMVNIKSSKYT